MDTQKVTRSSVITYPHLETSRLVGEKGLRGSETRVKTLLVAILEPPSDALGPTKLSSGIKRVFEGAMTSLKRRKRCLYVVDIFSFYVWTPREEVVKAQAQRRKREVQSRAPITNTRDFAKSQFSR